MIHPSEPDQPNQGTETNFHDWRLLGLIILVVLVMQPSPLVLIYG